MNVLGNLVVKFNLIFILFFKNYRLCCTSKLLILRKFHIFLLFLSLRIFCSLGHYQVLNVLSLIDKDFITTILASSRILCISNLNLNHIWNSFTEHSSNGKCIYWIFCMYYTHFTNFIHILKWMKDKLFNVLRLIIERNIVTENE